MERVLEAIYSQGVLKPLAKLDLSENQRVHILLTVIEAEDADLMPQAWHEVYAGLPDDAIDETEAIALDHARFLDRQPRTK